MLKRPAIVFKTVKEWNPLEIVRLYRAGGWWRDEWDPSRLAALMQGSFFFVLAVDADSGEAVGMGRAISDGASDAYIQDVVVLPEFRGQGIGCQIVERLISHLEGAGIGWIAAVSNPDTEGFYESLGFRRMIGFVPMLYRGAGHDLPV
ncbi:MAG: GNAT family N-acetyltransferase [Methanomicrobiales archaeon]|nr:GNAT family N-acetyltransferase [Methanomicrobiales archaeon]